MSFYLYEILPDDRTEHFGSTGQKDRRESKYTCSKTYGHERGLSCCFRQHRAKSHCSKLHGYSLSVAVTFGCTTLDENGWVVDFGQLKPFLVWLKNTFDHKTLVAQDDPALSMLKLLEKSDVCDLNVLPAVGCEAFAHLIFVQLSRIIARLGEENRINPTAFVVSVEVAEHGSNAARYEGDV